jgi:predicted negative regulator of RcsB-dependent stress response
MSFIKKILLALVLIFGYANISSSEVEARSSHSKLDKKAKKAAKKKKAKKTAKAKKKSKKSRKTHKNLNSDRDV